MVLPVTLVPKPAIKIKQDNKNCTKIVEGITFPVAKRVQK